MAPKTLCFSFLPGVITSCRSPFTIQVDRSQGSRLTWASSSPGSPRLRAGPRSPGVGRQKLGRGEAARGEPDHHQAQGEAPGALQQGHDLELAIGGLGEDVGGTQEWTWPRWVWWNAPTRLLLRPLSWA